MHEGSALVRYSYLLFPGESVTSSPDMSTSIWPGWWLSSARISARRASLELAGAEYPLPGARRYSLLARIGGTRWHYAGGPVRLTNTTPIIQFVAFRPNDDAPGGGDGWFAADLQFSCRETG